MNEIRKALEDLLNNSTPDELRAELRKGNRPFFQTLEDPVLISEPQFSVPAFVSFFQGTFAQESPSSEQTTSVPTQTCLAANQELALAA